AARGVVAVSATPPGAGGRGAADSSRGGGASAARSPGGGGVWTANWDASAQPQGSPHTIGVRATDTIGQTAVASVGVHVDNFPGDPDPTASISAPADGSILQGNVTIDALATDDV